MCHFYKAILGPKKDVHSCVFVIVSLFQLVLCNFFFFWPMAVKKM